MYWQMWHFREIEKAYKFYKLLFYNPFLLTSDKYTWNGKSIYECVLLMIWHFMTNIHGTLKSLFSCI